MVWELLAAKFSPELRRMEWQPQARFGLFPTLQKRLISTYDQRLHFIWHLNQNQPAKGRPGKKPDDPDGDPQMTVFISFAIIKQAGLFTEGPRTLQKPDVLICLLIIPTASWAQSLRQWRLHFICHWQIRFSSLSKVAQHSCSVDGEKKSNTGVNRGTLTRKFCHLWNL